ncbi:MAG: ABC transporter permease [Pirellulales bacterium]|nr:ABC transporter permease [Pirellulales bacterium]
MLGSKNHHSNTSDVGALAKGGSLWQDAWRKLRCNRVAMVSMWILVAICGLALLTPLLPLDPPDRDRTDLQYEPPQLIPLFRPTFSLDIKAIQKSSEVVPAHGDSQTFEQRQQARDVAQNPYRIAGFPDLGPLSRWMVRTRYWLFGHWSLGPVAGRDLLGRDIFSRLFWGARVSLIVGLVATLVSLLIGVTWGAVAGYCGGFVDDLMMRIVDILYSIPFIFVVIFIITILGQRDIKMTLELVGIDRITIFFLVVGAIYWLTMARVVRGQVISLKHEPFIEAARALGVSQPSIIARHILPNLVSIVIVYLTLTIPRVMLFEAFLSFLGLGVEPPNVSWGLLANEGIKVINPVKIYWWLIVFPSVALGITLFSLNFLGDGLRDALDPKIETK